MSKSQHISLIQIITFLFSLLLFGFAAFGISPKSSLFFGTALVVIGVINPETILKLALNKEGFELTRHIPSAKETKEVIKLATRESDEPIAHNKLVVAAENRRPEEKSATDYLLLARVAWEEKRFNEGVRNAHQGLSLNPDSTVKSSLENGLGLLFDELENNYNDAYSYYELASKTDPMSAVPHYNLGNLMSKKGSSKEAEVAYRKAIELDPDIAAAYCNLGVVLTEQDRHGEAEANLRKAIGLDPDSANARNNLGILFAKSGRYVEGEELFRKSIALNRDYDVAYYNLGKVIALQDRPDEAEIAYDKAIEINPDYSGAYSNLGRLLHVQDRHEEAEMAYRKAIELEPDLATAHFNLSLLLAGIDKKEEADAERKIAIKLDPSLAEKE